MNDQAKALLLMFAFGAGVGVPGGRMTAPEVVRYVPVPPPLAAAPAPTAQAEPPPAASPTPPVETTPLPPVKVEAKPKEPPKAQQKAAPPRARPAPAKKEIPCAVIKREYERMTDAQRWSSYLSATQEQVARGKYCLGF